MGESPEATFDKWTRFVEGRESLRGCLPKGAVKFAALFGGTVFSYEFSS